MAVADDRPLRADARRNRAAIVRAARAVFAKDGRQAQMDDIARRAKVGVGTVYRHFPTKEALLEALAEDRFEELAGFAEEALEVEDPWAAFEGFLRRAAALHGKDRALSDLLQQQPGLIPSLAALPRLQAGTDELLRRGKAAGVVREDARVTDVGMLMCSLGRLGGPADWSWERLLCLVLDGFRAEAARTPLPD